MATILIIDDEEQALDSICDTLKFEEYDVLRAENGEVGLKIAQKELPDLILCDIGMPEIDGHQVLKEIRDENSPTLDIPFIFLTVKSNPDVIERGFREGAQDYITKPFRKNELLARVGTHLALKKTREELQLKNQILLNSNKVKQGSKMFAAAKLRDQLMVVSGQNEKLFDDCRNNPDALNRLSKIEKKVEEMLKIVEQYLEDKA